MAEVFRTSIGFSRDLRIQKRWLANEKLFTNLFSVVVFCEENNLHIIRFWDSGKVQLKTDNPVKISNTLTNRFDFSILESLTFTKGHVMIQVRA